MYYSSQVGPDGGLRGAIPGPLGSGGACCAACAKGALGDLSGSSLVTGAIVIGLVLWGFSKFAKAASR